MDRCLRSYVCVECKPMRRFSSKGVMRRHVRNVHGEVKTFYICLVEGCGRRYGRNDNYREHFRKSHSDVVWSDGLLKVDIVSDLSGDCVGSVGRTDVEVVDHTDDCPCDDIDVNGSGIVKEALDVDDR